MTRYYKEVIHNLFEMRKKMRNDALLSPTEKGEANRYLKAESEARMWKEECAKANREIQETVSKLQKVKHLLITATIVAKKVKELLRHIRCHPRTTMRHIVIHACIWCLLTVNFGTPNIFVTLWFELDYGTNPPLCTLMM
jgi:translation initiation factor 2B subunit (eIF-2B alpha/beta/delta family)